MAEIDLNTRIWPSKGTRAPIQDSVYQGGVQPIAEYDNNFNWSVSKDLHSLNDELGNLDNLYINEEGDTMEGDLNMDVYCLEYASGWEICNSSDGIEIENPDAGVEFHFTETADGNALEEIDGYTSWHAGNFDPDDYWTKYQADDRFLNVDGSDHMEGHLDVGGHEIVDVEGRIEFSSDNGVGLDFTNNSDGHHLLFQHTDGAGTEYEGKLNSGAGEILELQEQASYRHRFSTEGDYRNTGSIHSEDEIRTDHRVVIQNENRGGDGFRLSAANDRPYIAPIVDNDAKLGSEFYWRSGEWTVETPLNIEGDIQLNDNDVRGVESFYFTENADFDAGIHYYGDIQEFNIEDLDEGDQPIQIESGPVRINRELNVQNIENLNGLDFNSPGGTAIDLTKNADGSHYFWEHADGNGNHSETHLGIGSGTLQDWRLNGDVKHSFHSDGNYENWGGADFRGGVDLHDNSISGIETTNFTDGWATVTFDGTYRINERGRNNSVYSFDDEHVFDEGQVNFKGGSVYLHNTAGRGNNNDSYDMVWENAPSGKDFRIHMKEDPRFSSLEGNYGMLFSSDGNHNGPLIATDVDSGITHVEELRSVRDNRSGTPVAEGYFGNASDIGEIWYDPGPGEFRGKIAGGQVVRLGEPL